MRPTGESRVPRCATLLYCYAATCSMRRMLNFNPGPAALPREAVIRARRELLDLGDSGIGLLEHSHRGETYASVHREAIELRSRDLKSGEVVSGVRVPHEHARQIPERPHPADDARAVSRERHVGRFGYFFFFFFFRALSKPSILANRL